MSVSSVLTVLARWWKVSLPLVLICLAAGVGTTLAYPPSYTSNVQLLLLPSPLIPGQSAATNPFLQLSGSLVSTADIMRLAVSTPQVADDIRRQNLSTDFTVGLDSSAAAPVLLITVTDHSPTVAVATANALVSVVQKELARKQKDAGAPDSTLVTATKFVSSDKPDRVWLGQIRAGIVVALVLMLAAGLMVFWLEGRRRRRWLDRAEAVAPASVPGLDVPGGERSQQRRLTEQVSAPAAVVPGPTKRASVEPREPLSWLEDVPRERLGGSGPAGAYDGR